MAKGISKALLYTAFGVNGLLMYSLAVTNMASIYILGELGGSPVTTSYTITFFALGNALTVPICFAICRPLGMRTTLYVCIIAFIMISFFMTFSPTYPIFLLFRFLQGCVSGPLLILIPSIISKLATQEETDLYIRNVTVVYIVAPAAGASLGGVFAYEWSWTWFAYIDTILGALLALSFFFCWRGVIFEKRKDKMDLLGYFFYAMALLSLSIFTIMGQELDWFRSYFLRGLFPFGIVSLIYFIIRLRSSENPLFNIDLLQRPQMLFAFLQVITLFAGYFAMVHLLSIWLNLFAVYTPNWIGAILAIMATSALFILLILDRYKEKTRFIALLIAIVLVAICNYQTMIFDVDVNFGRIALSRVIGGLGFALFLPPLFYLVLGAARREEKFQSLVLFQVARTLGCSIGLSIYATVWLRRGVFYHDRLGSEFTKFSQKTRDLFQQLKFFDLQGLKANEELERALERQSQSLALSDTFYLMYLITLALLLIAVVFYFFHRRKKLLKNS